MKLTEHFTMEELCASDTALRMGIANTPQPSAAKNLQRTAELAEVIRHALGDVPLHINSAFRCEALERVLCKPDFTGWCARRSIVADETAWRAYFRTKSHPDGRALDFTPTNVTPVQAVAMLARTPEVMLLIDQLICEGTWVHASWREGVQRGEVKTARFDESGIPEYTKGLV